MGTHFRAIISDARQAPQENFLLEALTFLGDIVCDLVAFGNLITFSP